MATTKNVERAEKPFLTRKPRGFREDPDTGGLRCPHRSISTCDACIDAHPNILDVGGECYWYRTADEIAEFVRQTGADIVNGRVIFDFDTIA